jgi:hypothetical protein
MCQTKPNRNQRKTRCRLGLKHRRRGRRGENEAKVLESQIPCRGRDATRNLARSLVEALCQSLGLWKVAARPRWNPACRQLDVALRLPASAPSLLGAMPTNLHVREVIPIVLLNVVDDRLMERPLVPFSAF